jgi:hypothetical protein
VNTPARVINVDEDTGEISVGMDQLGVSAAEVNQQIATAKAYPRSLQRFRQELLSQVTLSESIAQSCLYALPRGGKKIEGPSIRFAEIAMGCWGNCRATARIVAETENFIVAQGIFIDLERNVAVGIEVNRRIVDSKGKRYDVDMIGVTGAAASSIALRNAILRGIPRALFEEGYIAAKRTVAGTMATLADRRNRMLEAFKPYNVTEQQILAAVGKQGLVEIGMADLVTLGGFLTSIQQEERDPEDIFPMAQSRAQRQAAPAPVPQQQQPKPAASSPTAGATAAPQGEAGARSDAEGAGSEPSAQVQDEGAGKPDGDTADAAAGGSASAPAPSPDSEYGGLLESFAGNLLDCRTLADVDGVEEMFALDFANAPASVNEMKAVHLETARKAIKTRADADDFPGDRPMRGEG